MGVLLICHVLPYSPKTLAVHDNVGGTDRHVECVVIGQTTVPAVSCFQLGKVVKQIFTFVHIAL